MTTTEHCTEYESQKRDILARRRDIELRQQLFLKTLLAGEAVGELQRREDAPELEVSFALQGVEAEILREIDQALFRIDDGSYGSCERCGQQIAPARLSVHPIARLCCSCQEDRERAGAVAGTPPPPLRDERGSRRHDGRRDRPVLFTPTAWTPAEKRSRG